MTRARLLPAMAVADACLTCLLLASSPAGLRAWHALKAAVLLGRRVVTYRESGLYCYLLDFCYVPNAALLVHCWLLPHRPELLALMTCPAGQSSTLEKFPECSSRS